MGKYYCPVCQTGTDVVETRPSYKRVRRRRSCPNPECKHRFATVEVPHDTPKKLKDLANWFGKQGLDHDLVLYARAEIDSIVLGKTEEEDEE